MTVFPILLIPYDIIQFLLANKETRENGGKKLVSIWFFIAHILTDLLYCLTIPAVYYIEDSRSYILDDLFVVKHH